MKIGWMRLARIERDDDPLMLEIRLYVFHSRNFLQDGTQLADTLIAIFAFGRDFDCLQDGVICPFGIERISWVGIVWSCGIHGFDFFFK